MGLIGKVITGAIGAKLLNRLQNGARTTTSTTPQAGAEYIPANQLDPVGTGPSGTAGALVERAGRFYRENPKLVTVGSAALAIALAALAKRRGAM